MSSVSLQPRESDNLARGNVSAEARIGPNAVIQTLRAVAELEAPDISYQLARRAGIPYRGATQMIPEERFVRLVAVIRAELSITQSTQILARAGFLTAGYVASNRIPRLIRIILRVLPARLSIKLLLAAFRQHAWTFSGRSNFAVIGPYPGEIVLDDAPTCRDGFTGTMTGGYYAAAFEGLLSLACSGVHVVEVRCRSKGASACHFKILAGNESLTKRSSNQKQ